MVDMPLDKLLEIGWADLRKNQAHFNQVAQRTGAGQRSAARCSRNWAKIIPRPDKLLDDFLARHSTAWSSFIRAHHIVTIPSDVRPIVEETPPFMRATTFASHGHAGPIRDARHRSLLQRDAARSVDDARGGGGLHAFVQHRHGDFDGGARGLSRPLRAVPVGAAGAQPRAQDCWAPIPTSKAGRTTASR